MDLYIVDTVANNVVRSDGKLGHELANTATERTDVQRFTIGQTEVSFFDQDGLGHYVAVVTGPCSKLTHEIAKSVLRLLTAAGRINY